MSGFYKASGSKFLMVSSVVLTGASIYLHALENNALRIAALRSGNWLRVALVSQFAFRRVFPELFVGLYLLYAYRQIEREIGTRRFLSHVVFSTALSLAMQALVVVSLTASSSSSSSSSSTPSGSLLTLSTGPYGILFSLLVYYFGHIPKYPIIPSLGISNKFPTYACAALLAGISWWSSVIPSLCGFLAGCMVKVNPKLFFLPEPLARAASEWIDPWFRSLSAEEYQQHLARMTMMMGGGNNNNAFGGGGFDGRGNRRGGGFGGENLIPTWGGGGAAPVAAANLAENLLPPPSEESITTLVDLGFERALAINALRRYNNDVNAAANFLLTEGGGGGSS